MITLWLFVIPIVYIIIKLCLYLLVKKFGKISYDGFNAFGFAYNSEKDIFYSTQNAWQKNFGYTHTYDVWAPIFNMIIDTEPIKFYYDNKWWLITFWKGQYGIVTGAEVGIYYTKQKKVNKKTIYLPVDEKDMLDIDFILYKNGKAISRVHAKHWWLTIFKLGMFSKPKDLSMDINITFPNSEMLLTFLKAFHKKGYKSKEYKIIDNTFCFYYKKPKTRKIWTRFFLSDIIRQKINKSNVELYNKSLSDFIENNYTDDTKKINDEKFILVQNLIPSFLKNNEFSNVNKIKDKMINKESNNVVMIQSDIFSNVGAAEDDKKFN